MKSIVIVGGGAGGLELATQLGQKLGKQQKAQITLVDKNSDHLWKPLLHEIATGVIDCDIDNVNYLAQSQRNYFNFKQGALLDIDRKNKNIIISEVKSPNGEIIFPKSHLNYDVLVIAIGSQCNDFGILGVRENCIFLDDHIHAKQFKEKILNHFFRISSGMNTISSNKINIAIVGGGATGVELASELFIMVKKLANYGFIDSTAGRLSVTLIEASDRILPVLPASLSASINKKLEEYGVKVLTKTVISKADSTAFYTNENEIIKADIMVWAAGVKAPDFLKNIGGLENNHLNQLIVEPTLQTTRDDTIFAIGDCAAGVSTQGSFPPPTAQAAHQMAKICSHNIAAYLNNTLMHKFKYKDKGTIISLAQTAQGNVTTIGTKTMIVKGKPAYFIYRLLYRMHQAALYGIIKTCQLAMAGRIFRSVKPTIKLD